MNLNANNEPQSRLDLLLGGLIPDRFINGDDAFRVKVLWLYSTVLGGLGLIMLIITSTIEGEMPIRRLGTVALTALLIAVPIFMRYVEALHWISAYVCLVTVALIFYIDFNNASIAGPATVLWIIPFVLMSLLFSGGRLWVYLAITFALFIFNVLMLHQGWLPEPISQQENWVFIRGLSIFTTAVIAMMCTWGMSNLSKNHLKKLQKELLSKKVHIKQIDELKVQAEAAAHSKSLFLATMSHELRTPLNSVIGNAQLLVRADLPSKHHAQVNDISLAGNLLLMLINDILDFSKLEQGELALIEKPYDLTEQISDLCRMMMPKLKSGVNLTLDLPAETVHINGDKNRLSQVLMNLLSNAMKFTDSGVITVALTFFENNGVKVSIHDSGIGINAQDVTRLFTEFSQFTNDSVRNSEGTGLGLAISMGLVKRMGGDIVVDSEINKGSCFSVILPSKKIAHSTEKTNDSLPEKTNERLILKHHSILIVDDIAMNCTVLEAMLMDFDANDLRSVTSGEKAVEYIEKNIQTQLILMDVRMPGIGGVQATKNIRSLGFSGAIIAVTANASEEDREACINAGMDDFIAKPVAMDALERVLLNNIRDCR